MDPYSLEREIEELKNKRRQLEPVNMKAIEQFKEVRKRYEKLKQMFEEVRSEKVALEEHLQKIEVEKKRVFMNTFDKVSRSFRDIFSTLSGGGEASLVLENPEDPFQGGVKIFARPPGKKLKSIEVMSGGEKTLTALSLIFAIQHVRPSFFYILDEIDAALDDANAKKVAKLIREMANRSQFIVVTLRDVTMSEADKLIGVTGRNGLSKVIELTLEEAKKYGQ
jgi:chromosome segregation protein